ncbi:MAG: type I DNA topoisomerase [Candidatus Paceibacterota bacterium]|jgi:DNA topoisomerase-1
MKLLIVESPSKAKTISKYLHGEYTVKASVGHVRDLPKSNKDAIDIEGGFIPNYEITPGKEAVVSELKSLARKADEVILATDPDREGEAIAWHIAELIGGGKERPSRLKMKRVAFHEITERAVNEAMAHPRDIDQNLRKAQEARRVLDRLVGYDLSGLIWKKVRYGLSAGRVQSPALRILCEREREIKAFIPKDFWVISALTNTPAKKELSLAYSEKPEAQDITDDILAKAKKGVWQVSEVKKEKANKKPRAPFTTSTIQQAASSQLGFNPGRTMRAAQKLYENGLITYMRTDSTSISQDALPLILETVTKKFGADYVEQRVFTTKVKNAQEAHEAIRPTNPSTERAGTSDDEKRLYSLIWSRTIASQMKDAIVNKTKVSALVSGTELKEFTAAGSQLLFPGWLKADLSGSDDDVILPDIAEGDILTLISIDSEQKQTMPPPRYTEAGLIKELEKRGIGRPSTYASIIETLLARKYVDKEQKSLKPTDVGEVVSGFLETHFADIISDSFTAEMEDELDEIADGTRDYTKTLKAFYGPFTKLVKEKGKIEKVTSMGDADQSIKCPKCGGPMEIKLSKMGRFLSCKRFPDCDGALTIEGKILEKKEIKETGEMCPECGKGKLVEREGKNGRFIACSRYPKCKFVKVDPNAPKPPTTGVECPVCKKGEVAERRGRFGPFFSCNNYPACKFIMKSRPTGRICELCGSLMMEGTKTIPERCSDKACKNNLPVKKNLKE